MNEAEVTARWVLPVLEKCGIRPEEISLERSFKLKVGRYTYRIDTKEQITSAQPRLDLLISRNGKNLFVIEVKTDGHEVTDDDRDQGISYARLVHPMAPYAVVTNGTETKFYDPVSKNCLGPEDLRLVDGYEVTLTEDLRYEAQRLFLGYSAHNLNLFCTEQTHVNLRPLIGSRSDRARKYIPELHTPRQSFLHAVHDFLDAESRLFVLLGASGMGKTCALCHLTDYTIS